jgi:hypothetical protein
MRRLVIIGIAFAVAALPALAVEGALGRTLPGVWIQPQGAVIGPSPGFSFTTLPIGYMGAIGGAREVPIGGSIFANVDANVNSNYLVPQYVYKTETPKVTFASSFMGVVNWVGSNGSLQFNDFSRSTSTSNAGMGDVVIVPLTAGIHFSDNNNLTISTVIFAPTGQFRPGNLSNLGLGEWTIMPNVAHTYLLEERGLEFDNFVGFDIYSQNSTAKYTSGTMFHWDGTFQEVRVRRDRFQPHTDYQRQRTGCRCLAWLRRPSLGYRPNGPLRGEGREARCDCSAPLGERIRGDEPVEGQHVSARLTLKLNWPGSTTANRLSIGGGLLSLCKRADR